MPGTRRLARCSDVRVASSAHQQQRQSQSGDQSVSELTRGESNPKTLTPLSPLGFWGSRVYLTCTTYRFRARALHQDAWFVLVATCAPTH
jgi:hypothetical protein